MGLKENNRVRTFGIIPAYGADPIPVRLITEEAGAGMKENNRVRTFGVIPTEGADPIPVSIDFPANMCRIKIGQYTGDGTTGQAVTGVGFKPKWLKIYAVHPVSGIAIASYEKLDQGWGDFAIQEWVGIYASSTDRINSLDADGFTVDDAGVNNNPNALGSVYDYIALG